MSTLVHDARAQGHDHLVGFYDGDEALVSAVVGFFGEGLRRHESIVTVATPEHGAAIEHALADDGFLIDELTAVGRYRSFDARETLEKFTRDGTLDAVAFESHIGPMVASDGRAMRVFGEMVGLLWNDGDIASAIELESMWNNLGRRHSFALYCAYQMSAMETTGDLAATKQVCDQHSQVVSLVRDPADHSALDGSSDSESCARMFVPTATVLRAVRGFVADTLKSWHADQIVDDASIIACELATNALIHARSPFFVGLSRTPSAVTIAVRDTSTSAPEHLAPDPARIGGRGIPLIAALSQAWGTADEADGKTVWVELPA